MYTEKSEKVELTMPKIDMAFEQVNRPKRQIMDRPTTEEHEAKKKDFASQVSKELINAFTPEDRFDIFNEIRSNLEKALKEQAEQMAYKIESDVKYFELIKNLIY
jgi:hypothetical protein